MPLQNFIDNSVPTIKAAWLNALDVFYTTLFQSATTPAQARTALGAAASGPLAASGITGAAASGANTDITALAAPALGAATATTAAVGDSTTKVSTTAFVGLEIARFVATINDFRLTLTSGSPVTTADVGVSTTIYLTPYTGTAIALYDGTNWNVHLTNEVSLAIGTVTAGLPYDMFATITGGVVTLEQLAWSSATARATALVYQDGILCKSGATTRRYIGTYYTVSTTQTIDTVGARYLWNFYNRVPRKLAALEETANWTYTTAAYQEARGQTTNQLNFVIGTPDVLLDVSVDAGYSNTNLNVTAQVAIGLDTTTSPIVAGSMFTSSGITQTYSAGALLGVSANWIGYPGIGLHYLAWLEYSAAVGTTTWYGGASGIYGSILG